jgi:hypothetical protein
MINRELRRMQIRWTQDARYLEFVRPQNARHFKFVRPSFFPRGRGLRVIRISASRPKISASGTPGRTQGGLSNLLGRTLTETLP